MKLHTLKPAVGSTKKRKRVGRGQGSGKGGTSTRGHNGAQSRSGYSRKEGFEGGQMPLQRRVPKFGFKNHFRVAYKAVNLDTLQAFATEKGITEFTHDVLCQNGLADKKDRVKILSRGEITSAITITAHAYSKAAKAAIEAAGGQANTL